MTQAGNEAQVSTTSFKDWDFTNFHVQQEMKGGQFVSAETTLIAAGGPVIPSDPTGDDVYPIGVLETFGIQQSKQLQRIFEIGSSRSYFIPGRVVGSFNLGRTFYFGPSLLRVLYAYYYNDPANFGGEGFPIGTKPKDTAGISTASENYNLMDPQAALIDLYREQGATLHNVRRAPGEDYFWIDLASDLFSQPFGIAVYFKDANHNTLGAFFLENSYIQGHQMTISSGSVLIMEAASAQFERVAPIKFTTD
jgi:hypothetical protein